MSRKKDLVPRYTTAEPAEGPTRNEILAHYGISPGAAEDPNEREMREWEEAQARKLSGKDSQEVPRSVPLTALAHNPLNPREHLTEISETAESLRQRGLLQPLAVVRRAAFLAVHGDRAAEIGNAEFVVIDGNRRLAAAHEAGLDELRIDVNDGLATSAADILEAALIANVQRVDVEPIAQAKALQELVDVHGSQNAVAKRLGKSGAWVSQRLALLELPDDLQEKVEAGSLPVRDARRIGRLPAEEQRPQAEAAITRAAGPRARQSPAPEAPTPPAPAHPADRESVTVDTEREEPLTAVVLPQPSAGGNRAIPSQNGVPDSDDPIWQNVDAINELLHARMGRQHLVQLTIRLATVYQRATD
ncbi:ParB/RepB/Spo0J family partition protein [Streptomyces sp. NPDC048723]|uniref:ParB/RepB/Spo0J family partition protein n=1 Tax=Streptomyces sp. NPDC048723 TaxID=3365589 RepID=UPI00371203A8